jgi:hypothetical protein
LALAAVIVIALALMKEIWLAWPIIFVLYVLLSLFYKEPTMVKTSSQQTLDVTV